MMNHFYRLRDPCVVLPSRRLRASGPRAAMARVHWLFVNAASLYSLLLVRLLGKG